MKKKGVCFGRSAGGTVRNSSTSPMKRGASSVRRLPHRALRPFAWLKAARMEC